MEGLTAVSLRLMSGRHVVKLWPHKRSWRFEWLAETGRAKRASTIRLKRVRDRICAVVTYEVELEGEKGPAAFDVSESTVVVARVDLKAAVDREAQWNRGWIQPPTSIKAPRTDLDGRPDATTPLGGGGPGSFDVGGISGVCARGYGKRAKRMSEHSGKRNCVNKAACELTKDAAESQGCRQEASGGREGGAGLRHRVKQTLVEAVVEKAGAKPLSATCGLCWRLRTRIPRRVQCTENSCASRYNRSLASARGAAGSAATPQPS
jgi:hypothetical protein